MNNLSDQLSFSFTSHFPQPWDPTLPADVTSPFEQFDSLNDPFSEVEQSASNPAIGTDLFLEQLEHVDPRLLTMEYPDPLMAQQPTCYPIVQAQQGNSDHTLQSRSSHLDNIYLMNSDYPFCMENSADMNPISCREQSKSVVQTMESRLPRPRPRKEEVKNGSSLPNRATSKKGDTRWGELSKFDPDGVYDTLSRVPSRFDKLHYTQYGELDPSITFTANDVKRYLAHHPLNARRSSPNDASGVTLWIQRNPADSKMRYHHQVSARCRFRDCPAVHNLISQGFYRIALDEHGAKGDNYDPIGSNAACFHLYCFEKFLDFPRICQDYNVQVDTRTLENEPNGKNRMMLGSSEEVEAAERFLESCEAGIVPANYPHYSWKNRPYESTLSHLLAKEMFRNRGSIAAAQLLRRTSGQKASHWTVHMGNLEVQATARALTRTKDGQAKKTRGAKASMPKSQRRPKEPVESKANTLRQVRQNLLQNTQDGSRQYEGLSRAKVDHENNRLIGWSTSSSEDTHESCEPASPPQAKKQLGRPPKRSREEEPTPVVLQPAKSSYPRTILMARGSGRPSALPSLPQCGKRLRSRENKVNYVEPSTDLESEVDDEPPVRTSKRRRVRRNYAESDSGLSMGDTIVVKC